MVVKLYEANELIADLGAKIECAAVVQPCQSTREYFCVVYLDGQPVLRLPFGLACELEARLHDCVAILSRCIEYDLAACGAVRLAELETEAPSFEVAS